MRRNKQFTAWLPIMILGMTVLASAAALVSCVQAPEERERAPAKSCLDCHPAMAERFKQGYIHEPVNEDRCDRCHLPHGLIGVVILREEEPDLCYTCHRELEPDADQVSVHSPVAGGQCHRCHNPHNSKYPGLLTSPGEELCFTCHARDSFSGKYFHAPLEQGCGTCHDPHKSGSSSLLVRQADELCLGCHQPELEAFVQAHMNYPVRSACLQCHTAHAGDRATLQKKNVHEPVAQGKCSACHTVEDSAIVTDRAADRLCLDCHEKPADDMTSSHKPYREGQCTSCHLVHASDDPVLLAAPKETICLSCHRPESQPGGKPGSEAAGEEAREPVRSIHEPVEKGQCMECHTSHDSGQATLLREEPGTLCFRCHDRIGYSSEGKSHPPASGESCATCHLPHESTSEILLADDQETLCFSCHRVQADERGRFSLHQPFATGNCTGCHSLHTPEAKNYLKKEEEGGALCTECHGDIRAEDATKKPHTPVAEGRCDYCHAAHSADYGFVIRQKPGVLCRSCHGKVSDVIRKSEVPHQPALRENCITCHAAHGSPHDHILKKGQPLLCLSCHREVARYWQDGRSHQPAVKNCMECHSAHGSTLQGILNSAPGELCNRCHQTEGEQFLGAHQEIRPGPESCINCHDSHGGPEKGLLYPVGHSPFAEGTCKPCHSGRAK